MGRQAGTPYIDGFGRRGHGETKDPDRRHQVQASQGYAKTGHHLLKVKINEITG